MPGCRSLRITCPGLVFVLANLVGAAFANAEPSIGTVQSTEESPPPAQDTHANDTGAASDAAGGADTRRPEWIHLPASDPNLDFYMDRNSVVTRDGEIEFWDVVIFRKPTQRDEASDRMIKEKRTLRRINCASQEQSLLKGSSFDEQGHLIEALTLPPAMSQRAPVRSGTIAASELYRACKEAGQDVPLEPSPAAATTHP